MLIRLREAYIVTDGHITLDVQFGNGQKSYAEVLLNGNLLTSSGGDISLNIGNGPLISGQKLRIIATVTDTNPMTNRTSVTYTLSGGKADRRFQSSHDVDSEGDTVDYDAIFLLL